MPSDKKSRRGTKVIKISKAHKRRTVEGDSKPDIGAVDTVPKAEVPALIAQADSSHNSPHVESLAQNGGTDERQPGVAPLERKPRLDEAHAPQTAPEPATIALRSANALTTTRSDPSNDSVGEDGAESKARADIDFDKILPFMRKLLKPHQREGVMRMVELEAGPDQGGILADEMGLGKTIQFLSIVAVGKYHGDCLPTLIIIPGPTMLKQCSGEILQHTNLRYLEYHGSSRSLQFGHFKDVDIVLTTYDMLRKDLPRQARNVGKETGWTRNFRAISNAEMRSMEEGYAAPLFDQDWQRVILDEGQNPATSGSIGVCGLSAQKRWFVTGTPLWNGPKDIFQATRIPGVHAEEMTTLLQSMLLPSNKSKKRGRDVELSSRREAKLRVRARSLFKRLAIRRKKADVLQELPTKTAIDLHMSLRPEHEVLYKAASCKLRARLADLKNKNLSLKQWHDMQIVVMLRLQQIAACPVLVTVEDPVEADPEDIKQDPDDQPDYEVSPSALQRPNRVHDELASLEDLIDGVKQEQLRSKNCWESSSKLDALVYVLERTKAEQPERKVVVYSRWTAFLRIIERHLEATAPDEKVACFHGGLNADDRSVVLDTFRTGGTDILLINIMCGGQGLNLTTANHVVIMEPGYTAAIEMQAEDRVHRIGQTQAVCIWRMLAKRTVDLEDMVPLQESKLRAHNEICDGILPGGELRTPQREKQDFDEVRKPSAHDSPADIKPPAGVMETEREPIGNEGQIRRSRSPAEQPNVKDDIDRGIDDTSDSDDSFSDIAIISDWDDSDEDMSDIQMISIEQTAVSNDSDDGMSDIQVISHKRTHASSESDDDMSGIRILKQEEFIAECSKSARSNDTMESRPTKRQKRA